MRLLLAAVIALLPVLTLPVGAEQRRPVIITDGRSVPNPAPFVLVLHGFTSTGAALRRRTGFDALVHSHGFSVAYPTGPTRRWDDSSPTFTDMTYLTNLILSQIALGRADPDHIYIAGHSNGGAMALRMSCAQPDLIRAIAVVAMNAQRKPQCPNGAPMPALFIHGSGDPIIPPEGLPPSRNHGGFLSTSKTLEQWSRRNRCGPPAPIKRFNQTGGDTTAAFIRYTKCAAGLLHITLRGHGHEWPGAGRRATWLQGPASRELDAASAIWQFFAAN